MSLRDELACIIFDDERPALPPYKGPPLDEECQFIAKTPTEKERAFLMLLPQRRAWETERIAKVAGLTVPWTVNILNRLVAMGLVERMGGESKGYGRGRAPFTWRRSRGSSMREVRG